MGENTERLVCHCGRAFLEQANFFYEDFERLMRHTVNECRYISAPSGPPGPLVNPAELREKVGMPCQCGMTRLSHARHVRFDAANLRHMVNFCETGTKSPERRCQCGMYAISHPCAAYNDGEAIHRASECERCSCGTVVLKSATQSVTSSSGVTHTRAQCGKVTDPAAPRCKCRKFEVTYPEQVLADRKMFHTLEECRVDMTPTMKKRLGINEPAPLPCDCSKRLEKVEAAIPRLKKERDDEMLRANALADQLGEKDNELLRMRRESETVLADNARLRRSLEDLQRKSKK